MKYTKKDNVIRLKSVIESDRLSLTRESMELIIKDVGSVLADYFELLGRPEIKVEPKDGRYEITVNATAQSLKTFAAVP